MNIQLQHESGATKQVKVGFSWTVFFFGMFVPLIRGDLKWAVIMFATASLAAVLTMGFGAFAPGLIFSFVYNKLYTRDLLEKGYRPTNEEDSEVIQNYVNS